MLAACRASAHQWNRASSSFLVRANAARIAGGTTPQRNLWFGRGNKDGNNDGNNSDDSEKPKAPEKSTDIVKSENEVTQFGVGEKAPKPPHLLAVGLPTRPLIPGFMSPLTVQDDGLINSIINLKKSGQPYIGLFLNKTEKVEGDPMRVNDIDQIHRIGTMAQITQIVPVPDAFQVMVMGHRRVRITDQLPERDPLEVLVHHIATPARSTDESSTKVVKAYTNNILSVIREVIHLNPMFKEHVHYFTQRLDVQDAYRLADFAASITTADGAELQEVLEAETLEHRLSLSLVLLQKELQLSKLQREISQEVEKQMSENQRKYFLMEQLKSIKRELGMEKDDKDALIQKYKDRVKDLDMPENARETFDEQIEKLSHLERNSAEFNGTRDYLDWLSQLPWGKFSQDRLDVHPAKDVLDEDHYGMKEVKDRILEFIAVGKLKGMVHGKIICLVGPPGVGKTSIGKSIARAINREFFRFSVGGMSDVAEIKGHRRTYIGAMPGKLIQCMKTTGVSNPLMLIDEIDKIGSGRYSGGDPTSALLEMLDPNQNETFLDHYIDTPIDASKVLFVCTANVLDTIPGPLLDRMEVIELSGYDAAEKLQIARTYLEPKAREETGLVVGAENTPKKLELTDSAVDALIRWYCRESGVRNLEQHINKIYRKAAYKAVTATPEELENGDWCITAENLEKYVGKPRFTTDRLFDSTPAGVVMGLAWTSMGGSALYIEITSPTHRPGQSTPRRHSKPANADTKPGIPVGEGAAAARTGSLKLTGKMGEVMQESAQIAYTFARSYISDIDETNEYLEQASLHMHVPEGATPKDGPSAGCTMVTGLLSIALGKPVRPEVAMTGELSLTGKVLAIGGVKEKTMAARRSGAKVLIFPEANRKDWEELPDHLTEGMEVHFASSYDDVYKVALDY